MLVVAPHYNSTLLSVSLPEAANVHYYHATSLRTTTGNNSNYVIIQLQIGQQLLLRYLTSGQFLHFTRDYISYMMSVQHNYYLPTTQHPQTIYKVEHDMTTFTDNYSIWNYHMPLLLPDLLHYLYSRDQLHDFQHKAITTILCKSAQYYGFTLLTMTNLTLHHKTQLLIRTSPGCSGWVVCSQAVRVESLVVVRVVDTLPVEVQ